VTVQARILVEGTAQSLADLELARQYLLAQPGVDLDSVVLDEGALTIKAHTVLIPWDPTPPGTPAA
jgi:hypothetical protein